MSARNHGRHRAAEVSSASLLVDAVSRSSAPTMKAAAAVVATGGMAASVAIPNSAPVAAAPEVNAPQAVTTLDLSSSLVQLGETQHASAIPATLVAPAKLAAAPVAAAVVAVPKTVTHKPAAEKSSTVAQATSSVRSATTTSRSATRRKLVSTPATDAPSPRATRAETPKSTPTPTPTSTPAPSDDAPARGGVIGLAQRYSGIWYVYGGTTPDGFDCSGYVQYIFDKLGVSLPRTAEEQRQATTPVSNPRVGDLVFFGYPAHHVGIYAGDGMMYDSPRTGKQSGLHKIWSSDVSYGRP